MSVAVEELSGWGEDLGWGGGTYLLRSDSPCLLDLHHGTCFDRNQSLALC